MTTTLSPKARLERDIVNTLHRLRVARLDGNCEAIMAESSRLNDELDRYPHTANAAI